ncbi:WbuC family cupin fold metalloprotein [Pseudoalteromonas sp. MMG005]|uniref:WbuC family cupin fold metalloprotein n=1 Tax=Pseudoalteromonas sp. MMG005 TaxID=2822682 RepID=UPI001B3A4E22|nr:WbuC family cupin fold metalloprotein [Pseudoalteromonas sp. MMG005]MBQ4846324.1 WbuC family cupin fold metalloprotein [Pseudoalteromonas sp. MMG005]
MSNAIFIKGNIRSIGKNELKSLKEKAYNSDNGRYRYCLHTCSSDDLQNMLIAITSESVLLPQRRVGANKCFTILEGEIILIILNNDGSIVDSFLLEKLNTNTVWVSDEYYTLTIPRSKISVYQETITGNFSSVNDHPSWLVDKSAIDAVISQLGIKND